MYLARIRNMNSGEACLLSAPGCTLSECQASTKTLLVKTRWPSWAVLSKPALKSPGQRAQVSLQPHGSLASHIQRVAPISKRSLRFPLFALFHCCCALSAITINPWTAAISS